MSKALMYVLVGVLALCGVLGWYGYSGRVQAKAAYTEVAALRAGISAVQSAREADAAAFSIQLQGRTVVQKQQEAHRVNIQKVLPEYKVWADARVPDAVLDASGL